MKLELHDICEFLCAMLTGCKALKDLSLIHVYGSHQRFMVPHPTTSPVLESVCVFRTHLTGEFLLYNPVAEKMLSRLRTFSVGFHCSSGTETERAADLIMKVPQTLETLNIIYMNHQLSSYHHLPLLSGVTSNFAHHTLLLYSKR